MMTMLRATAASAIAATALLAGATAAPAQSAPELQPETSDTMRADPPNPNWFYVEGGWDSPGTSIFDGQTGKMKGLVDTARLTDFAIDPAGRYYYVAESLWSPFQAHGN